MFNYISYKIESNIKLTFFLLFIFHVLFATFIFLIANSEYLSYLHNGEGLWNFAADSFAYHREAVVLVHFLQDSQWDSWWTTHANHPHVRFVSLLYWITGYKVPIVYELVNGLVWTISLMVVYRSSQLLWENNSVVPILTVLFFLQPSVLLSSTQLLRDSIILLGVCCLCYGWIIISKTKLHLRGVIYIVVGSFLFISLRQYLGLILLVVFSLYLVYLLLKNKISLFNTAIILLSISLIITLNWNFSAKAFQFLNTEVEQVSVVHGEYKTYYQHLNQ